MMITSSSNKSRLEHFKFVVAVRGSVGFLGGGFPWTLSSDH
jgi:hypothetical protein